MTRTSVKLVAGVMAILMITSLGAVPVISTTDSTDSSTEKIPLTRDEIAQEVHGDDFKALSDDTQAEIEELYDRQPFAEGVSASDLQTRDQLAQSEHGVDEFEDLSSDTKHEIEETYDEQFADASEKKKYSRDEIADAKYGEDFDELSAETTWQVEELYDRQPFVSFAGTHDPADILTRDEIANEKYNEDFNDLSEKTQHAVEDLYDQQFSPSVTSDTTETSTPEDTPTATATPEDTPTETATPEDTPTETTTSEDTTTTTTTPEDTTTTTTTTPEDITTTTTTTPEDPLPAFFEVDGFDVSDVEDDGTVTITVTVENTGEQSGEQTVSIIGGNGTTSVSEDEELALDAGETGEVTFEVNTAEIGTGEISLSLETESDQEGTAFTLSPPDDSSESGIEFFEITDYDLWSDGDTVFITVTVENNGDERDEQTVSMTVGTEEGGVSGDEQLALDPGETSEVTFEADRSELGSGLATLNVDTQADGLSTTFNVDDVVDSSFILNTLSVDTTDQGDTFEVTTHVSHHGDDDGERKTQTLTVTIETDEGSASASEEVELPVGATDVPVTIEVDRSGLGSGDATVTVISEDDSVSGTFNLSSS